MRTQFRYNALYGDYPTITKFAFSYNDGKGTMSLNLEIFFERAVETKSKSFLHTTKTDIKKVLALVKRWANQEQTDFLLKWLGEHDCADLVETFNGIRCY